MTDYSNFHDHVDFTKASTFIEKGTKNRKPLPQKLNNKSYPNIKKESNIPIPNIEEGVKRNFAVL